MLSVANGGHRVTFALGAPSWVWKTCCPVLYGPRGCDLSVP
jgi:hypothetical protein